VTTVVLTYGEKTRQRRQRGLWLALLSLLFHLCLLGVVGFSTPRIDILDLPAELVVRLWLPEALSRRGVSPTTHKSTHQTAAEAQGVDVPSRRASTVAPEPQVGSPVAPEPPASAGGGSRPSQGAASENAQGAGENARAVLRAMIGCDLGRTQRLSEDDRDRCDQHAAEVAKAGPAYIDPIPQEKRAYYDAVQAAYQAAEHPEAPFYRDANGNIVSWGHPPGVGCTLKPRFKPGTSMADKIKATGMVGVPIGPLRCGLILPQGSFTPEIGIPTP